MRPKTSPGNYFEDFQLGQKIVHATPRTLTEGDVALYTALYGSRFAVNSSSKFAASLGLRAAPIDSLLDISHRIRQNSARCLSERHCQPRLCMRAIWPARLSR